MLDPAANVVHARGRAGALVDGDAGDHRVGADLGAVCESVGDVSDQRRRLGIDLAALQAESAVDAVRPIPEAPVGDRDRSDFRGDAQPVRAAQEYLPVAAYRVRAVRVAVRIAPGPVLAGDGQFAFDVVVVGPQVVVADRPVGTDAVAAVRVEVARVKPRRVAGVVHHRPADSAAGVVGAQRDRVVAGDHPRFGPVQVVRAGFVADPVRVRIPERSGVQRDHVPAGAGQPLQHAWSRPRRSRR